MDSLLSLLDTVLDITNMVFALAILGGLVTILVLYIVDTTQTTQTIRRNYPVIGRLRYFFEHMGVFFRQYFFAMDREELPFNRAQRSWIARAAKELDGTLAFGSTRPLDKPGDIFFLNAGFPPTSDEIFHMNFPHVHKLHDMVFLHPAFEFFLFRFIKPLFIRFLLSFRCFSICLGLLLRPHALTKRTLWGKRSIL